MHQSYRLKRGLLSLNNRIVKGGWVAPPNTRYAGKDYLTDEVFCDVKKSGINVLFGVILPETEFEDLKRFMDLCDKFDLYTVVPEETLSTCEFDLESFLPRLEEYKERKCVIGISIGDEPGVNHIDVIAKNIALIEPYLDHLILYMNHMPMYAKDSQIYGGAVSEMQPEISAKRYTAFLQDFYDKINISILSYDFYPFTHEKGVCHPKYYTQLCMFRELSEKYGRPFWNFTQVTSWSKSSIRNMTYSEIEWLNNTSLACGVEGIAYFCYWTPISKTEDFNNAMINAGGYKTDSYYFVQKANERLDAAAAVIGDAEFCGTIAFGDTLALFPEHKNLYSFGNLSGIAADGVLIGCYKAGEKNIYFVVNTSVTEARAIHLNFAKTLELSVTDGLLQEKVKDDKLDVTVNPGLAVVIKEC